MSNRDDFDRSTIEVLAKRAAYICSNPDCKRLTVAPSPEDETKFIYIGKASHITAASLGGPRYDPSLDSEERRSINNGIFLCSNCADMIDKNSGSDFPVGRLRKWKAEHETWVSENLNKHPQKESEPNQTFVVTSHNQTGGITAGLVNIGPPQRKLGPRGQAVWNQILTDKTKTVTVVAVLGDGEAFSYATQIKKYLIAQGYSVKGVDQAVYAVPISGQQFDPKTWTIIIGSRQ
jgi:hypothetical protein